MNRVSIVVVWIVGLLIKHDHDGVCHFLFSVQEFLYFIITLAFWWLSFLINTFVDSDKNNLSCGGLLSAV
jgi:hypothetical protein